MKLECDCGCGGTAYHSQMMVVEAEEAVDKDIRKTGTVKRFWVLRGCKEPFERELGLQIMLQKLISAWYKKAFWKRIFVARNVMRMQHAIWERTRGFEYAKVHATNSMVLFAAPRWMQGFLARRFARRLSNAERKRTDDQRNLNATATSRGQIPDRAAQKGA